MTLERQLGRALRTEGGWWSGAGLLDKFCNVFLADTESVRDTKLPSCLSEHFPSSHSKGEQTATLRVQTVYNYTRQAFALYDVGSYRDNDQGAADRVLKVARRGDMVLRDLGYFALANF